MYQPEFSGRVYDYAVKYLAKNVWKVGNYLDLDDLLQDSYLLFLRITSDVHFENDRHFFGYWRKSLRSMIFERRRQCLRDGVSTANDVLANCLESRELRVPWEDRVASAPEAVRKLLHVVQNKLRPRPCRRRRGGKVANDNQFLCRYAGVDESVPLESQLLGWLNS